MNRKGSPERRSTSEVMPYGDDPFICQRPPAALPQQWRLQLRSSSHDLAMPDYTSNRTDHSGYTDMSGLSFPRANFLKHMNEANPQEIAQALSPTRQEELLKVLSASQSPAGAGGTCPPTNTPLAFSEQDRAQIDAQTVSSFRSESQTLRKPQQRHRTCSEGSVTNDRGSSHSPQEKREKREGAILLPLGTKPCSLSISRHRSGSIGSKRKRGSRSPAISTGKGHDLVHIIVDSSSSGEGQDEVGQLKPGPSTDGGVSLRSD